jgi:hypothetical protein
MWEHLELLHTNLKLLLLRTFLMFTAGSGSASPPFQGEIYVYLNFLKASKFLFESVSGSHCFYQFPMSVF